jgi:hypothetical protein
MPSSPLAEGATLIIDRGRGDEENRDFRVRKSHFHMFKSMRGKL